MAVVLTGCSALPDKPTRANVYDFGPGAVAYLPANRMAPLPTLALDEVQASAALDSTAVLYRLAYADAQALKPYAQARWSMTPAQLLRQRLREHLGLRRAVLNAGEGSAPAASTATGAASPSQSSVPMLLRVELEEFSQLFESATASTGLVRLRATAVQASPLGEKLLGQRSFIVQRPAPSADAAGGVRALAAATDAAVQEIDQWLQQLQ
jgi:cholesterol transport system auxiliary component